MNGKGALCFCGRVPWMYQYWPGGFMLFVVLYCLWPCSLAVPVLAGWVLCFLWFFVQELPKAQPAVVLVLKRLRRRSNGLKSHPTDWEKPGIDTATPGLQDIGLSPTPRRLHFFVVLCPGTPEGCARLHRPLL